MQNPTNNAQFGNYGSNQGFGSYGRQGRRSSRGQSHQGGSMSMNQGRGQSNQFGNYGQGFGQYGQFGTYGAYGFGGPMTEDYELTEAWIIPGAGFGTYGQPGQQSQQSQQGQRSGTQGRSAQQQMMQPGPHTGKGPKRSDQHIDDEVRSHLTQHGHLDASNIDVNVSNGVVTLTGTVDSRQAKRTAEQVTDSVPGVKDVTNQLKIQQQQQQQGQQSQQSQQTTSTH
ncbi:MAG TPA: BON domain-containing protein [Thermomicrobiaceae bacterium]|nr:BON domain-containing protein [Thermomicrobiaceae bacterium]